MKDLLSTDSIERMDGVDNTSSITDAQIVEMYWQRDEAAISETQHKYGRYCNYIADNVLHNAQDAEGCVNDAYNRLWSLIPPAKPISLSAFLGKIVRGLAVDRWRMNHAAKRGGETETIALELAECFGAYDDGDAESAMSLRDSINRFLDALPKETRVIFMRRYWYMNSVADIAHALGMGESKVKVTLFRTRERLRKHLEKEGFTV